MYYFRAVNSALFISHGIREDTQIVLHLEGAGSRRIKFDGKSLKEFIPTRGQLLGKLGSDKITDSSL